MNSIFKRIRRKVRATRQKDGHRASNIPSVAASIRLAFRVGTTTKRFERTFRLSDTVAYVIEMIKNEVGFYLGDDVTLQYMGQALHPADALAKTFRRGGLVSEPVTIPVARSINVRNNVFPLLG